MEEIVEDDDVGQISESSFEDLFEETEQLMELHVGKVRNFTDRDVVLTILDERFMGGDLFANSDQIIVKKDSPSGIDLSKDVRYFKSPYLRMLFGLHKEDSIYKYIVFSHDT